MNLKNFFKFFRFLAISSINSRARRVFLCEIKTAIPRRRAHSLSRASGNLTEEISVK